MFWSHDLLGKKTALGAVWIAAHGKKLNKGRIMQVNVTEACKKVMDPEVPQALRLQAILVGGIVIVHAKQQVYLLEDAQEMLRRLRTLDSPEGGAGGGAAAPRAVLGEGKRAAREEAITLPISGDMHLLNLGELFPSFPTQALSQGGSGPSTSQVGEGLFVMPDGPEVSTGGGMGGAVSRQQRKGRGAAAAAASGDASGSEPARTGGRSRSGGAGGGLLLGGAEEGAEVELNLEGLPRHDLELMDGPETFAVPDIDLPGMDFFNRGGGLTQPGGSMGAAQQELEPPMPDDLVPVPSALGAEGAQQQQEQQPTGSQTPQASAEQSDGAKGGAAPPRGRRAGGRRGGMKRARPTVDDIDTLQIRGREYREWMTDYSDLLVARPLRSTLVSADASSAAVHADKSALAAAPATAAFMPGGAWPAELQGLFARCATLPSPEGPRPRTKKGKGKADAAGAAEQQQEEEEELSEEGERARHEAPLTCAAAEEGGYAAGMDYGFGFADYGGGQYGEVPLQEVAVGEGDYGVGGSGGGNQFRRRAAAAVREQYSSDYEEEDVETERLRAALNSTQGWAEPFFPIGLTPASADPSRPGSLATGRGGRGAKRGSSVLRRDSESGVASERSSEGRAGGRLSDLLEGAGPQGFNTEGAGMGADLGAMLPAVGEDEPYLDQEGEEEGQAGGSRKRQRLSEPDAATGPTGTFGTLSQFELLVASGPTQAVGAAGSLPVAPLGDNLNRQTLAFIGVMRGRFDVAESQLGDEAAQGGSQPSGCQLSLFDMAERLSRMDAAKLFYQVLVTRSHGFLEAEQEEPYGDILLSRGELL